MNKTQKLKDQLELTALVTAINEGSLDRCKELIAHGHDVNGGGWTALNAACGRGSVDFCRVLIEAGADVNRGRTDPMMQAIARNNVEICALLVSAGADVNQMMRSGTTYLIEAAKEGAVAACAFLLERGAVVDVGQPDGWTALLHAAAGDHVEIVRMLLESGASASQALACDKMPPLTAFQLAVKSNAAKVTEFFLGEGAEDPAQRTADGKTMRQLAGNHAEVRQLLNSVRAEVLIGGAFGGERENPSARQAERVSLAL